MKKNGQKPGKSMENKETKMIMGSDKADDLVKSAVNCTFLLESICIDGKREKYIEKCLNERISKIKEEIESDLKLLIGFVAEKRFFRIERKPLWYDKETRSFLPDIEKFPMKIFLLRSKDNNEELSVYKERYCEREFTAMTVDEARSILNMENKNPFLEKSGKIKFNGQVELYNYWWTTGGLLNASGEIHNSSGFWGAVCLPIYRIKEKYPIETRSFSSESRDINNAKAVVALLEEGLRPEGLDDAVRKVFIKLQSEWASIVPYIFLRSNQFGVLHFNIEKFINDYNNEQILEDIFGFSFDKETLQVEAEKMITEEVKQNLLESDNRRANMEKYDELQLTDRNRGHWELCDVKANSDSENIKLGEPWIARPPQLDIHSSGTCAIDFGTKSTVVVCRDHEEFMLRIGTGDYSVEPKKEDYENPTVMEFGDLNAFCKAYREREGRPFTLWEQITVSHAARKAFETEPYYSLFEELKQWANDKQGRRRFVDQKGMDFELKPYLELGENDVDPIEMYAYYLGLYINNMYTGIYLDYVLSFPVNYDKAVREKILQSFERGLRKSLPQSLQKDLKGLHFAVYAGASEPAAYAVSALEQYNLEPKTQDERVYYGVFDFGGGTTDFDFGVMRKGDGRRCKFEIEQFNAGGDVLLGGEHLLQLIAYEVYKDNLKLMRSKKIPFVLPADASPVAGTETLILSADIASREAGKNSYVLADKLRCVWENDGKKRKELANGPLSVTLFSAGKDKGEAVELHVKPEKLEDILRVRIEKGVKSFFQSLENAIIDNSSEDKLHLPINIFLAGNSCRSPIVQELFKTYIEKLEKDIRENSKLDIGVEKNTSDVLLKLWQPLGEKESDRQTKKSQSVGIGTSGGVMENDSCLTRERYEKSGNAADNILELNKLRTGKTGVAFGLLRTRRGARDVRIVNRNFGADNERLFPYELGFIDENRRFATQIGKGIGYGSWAEFGYADEPVFELYYTKDSRVANRELNESEVSNVRCFIPETEVSADEDVRVFIRKVKPDLIEYGVGKADDFTKEPLRVNIHNQQLK